MVNVENKDTSPLTAALLDTPLGQMLAVADEQALYVLDFTAERGGILELERLQRRSKRQVVFAENKVIIQLRAELERYFAGQLLSFNIPLCLVGTDFQKKVWAELQRIPYGQTRSYAEVALAIGSPRAVRAGASANAANPISIIVPCHRVINANGAIGGYGGGVERKQWLLEHEQKYHAQARR